MFQIILTSDTPTNNYLDYDPGCFRADLSETLNLNFGQLSWEVALSELFIYPKSWHAIREPFNFFRVSIGNMRVEYLEKMFYRCREYTTYSEDREEGHAGDIEVAIGPRYKTVSYHSWAKFRGLPIFYTYFPDPGIPHSMEISYADWPSNELGGIGFWYYRRIWGREMENRNKYPYSVFRSPIPTGTYSPQALVSYISEKCKEILNEFILELEETRDIRLM